MLFSVLSGSFTVSADSTLKEIISFDMNGNGNDGNYTKFQDWYMQASETNKRKEDNYSTDSSVYDIDGYVKCTEQILIPLSIEEDTDGKTTGIKRKDVSNLYVEVEYDFMIMPVTHSSTTSAGLNLVTYNTSGELSGDAFASLYHQYDPSTGEALFTRTSKNTVISKMTPVANKWYRCKLVSQITDANGNLPSGNAVKIYVDGENIATYQHKSAVSNYTDEFIRYIRLHQNNGKCGIDNLTVKTYTDTSDKPVEKGALIAEIRNFESDYPSYTEYDGAVSLINSAKAVYKNASATAEDVKTARANIKSAIKIAYPMESLINEDFEESPSDFFDVNDGITYVDNTAYKTGKVASITSDAKKTFSALSMSSSDTYHFADFDIMPESQTVVKLSDSVSYTLVADSEWKRVRILVGTDDKKYTIYVNGQSVATGTVSESELSEFSVTSESGALLDNLSVCTCAGIENVPLDRSELLKEIRDFELRDDDAALSDAGQAILSSAKTVYENTKATSDEIKSSVKNLRGEATTIFSYDFDSTENLNAFNKAIGSTFTVQTDSDTYGINKYITVKSGYYLPVVPAIERSANTSKNLYIEYEFDIKPEPTSSSYSSVANKRAAVQLCSNNTSDYKYLSSGIELNYTNETYGNDSITLPYSEGVKFSDFDYDKWYRCKVVLLLNDNGSVANSNNLVKYYIDGNLVYTGKILGNNFDKVAYFRFYSAYASLNIDNFSAKTYTSLNVPADKAKLVSEIRTFIKQFPNYKDNADALALFNSASAIYNQEYIKNADVLKAEGFLAQAERKLHNAEPLVKESFNTSPSYFFDKIGETSYNESSALPENLSFENDSAYAVEKAIKIPASTTAQKNFTAVSLGEGSSVAFLTAEADVKTAGEVTVKLSDSVSYKISNSNSEWSRIRFDLDTLSKKLDIYLNGENVTSKTVTDSEISSISFVTGSETLIDNVYVYSYENKSDVTADKGELIKGLRKIKSLLGGNTLTDDESSLIKKVFDKYSVVYEMPAAEYSDINNAATKVSFYVDNITSTMDGAKSVVIPGIGKTLTDVIVNLNLHHGSQEGNVAYDDIFFNGVGSTDFSDIRFYDADGLGLQSHIESHGNYDFIEDDNLAYCQMYYTSEGYVVARKAGYVQISKDNGNTWSKVGTGYTTLHVTFVDKYDNIYYEKKTTADKGGSCCIYKTSASDNYATEKLVIDSSDWDDMGVSKGLSWDDFVQDDDGYIYAGRYQTAWTGAAVFVSDETGENFRIMDFRPDKQHIHKIRINKYVYPNEVYVGIDDSLQQPLCYVTTDHLGYEEYKDDPDYQLPNKARSTGGREEYTNTTNNELGETRILMPANRVAQKIIENAKLHTTQVKIPYGNSDYFGYFGLIEDRETAPEKFEYNEEKGKWYTKKNKSYYNEVSGKTHYYSDNVYGIGVGEANILGGPGAYKTTDIMDPSKYYPVIKNAQGARRTMSPIDGVLIWGGLTGGFSQYPQICISYDQGENWETAYTYGYEYSLDAGNGAFRMMSEPYVHTDTGVHEVLMYGYGNQSSLRALFGGDRYMALSSVLIPQLPEDGIKIFVKTDGTAKETVTKHYYGTIDDDIPAIRSVKTAKGEADSLKFTLTGEGKSMVYSFDINTDDETVIEATLIASTDNGNKTVAKALFDTENGTVKLNDETEVSNDAVKSGAFKVMLKTYEDKTVTLSVNETDVCTSTLSEDYVKLSSLSFKTIDNDVTPTLSNPIVVYYSNVAYGQASKDEGQFVLDSVSYEKSGETVNEITSGTNIKTVTIRKLDVDITDAKLIACLYDGNDVLKKCKIVDVDGSGTYDVDLTAPSDGLTLKFILVKDLESIMPIKLTSCLK